MSPQGQSLTSLRGGGKGLSVPSCQHAMAWYGGRGCSTEAGRPGGEGAWLGSCPWGPGCFWQAMGQVCRAASEKAACQVPRPGSPRSAAQQAAVWPCDGRRQEGKTRGCAMGWAGCPSWEGQGIGVLRQRSQPLHCPSSKCEVQQSRSPLPLPAHGQRTRQEVKGAAAHCTCAAGTQP